MHWEDFDLGSGINPCHFLEFQKNKPVMLRGESLANTLCRFTTPPGLDPLGVCRAAPIVLKVRATVCTSYEELAGYAVPTGAADQFYANEQRCAFRYLNYHHPKNCQVKNVLLGDIVKYCLKYGFRK
jgi:hypothetical protein